MPRTFNEIFHSNNLLNNKKTEFMNKVHVQQENLYDKGDRKVHEHDRHTANALFAMHRDEF